MALEFRLLGPLEVLVDGRAAGLGAPRHRGVLVLLLTQANAVVPAHRLIDELWGDDPPASAQNLVQGAVSHLRKALGKDAIATQGSGYALRVEPQMLDLHRFERLAEEGSLALEDGHFDQAAAALGDALALWRGPALADLVDEDFAQPVAARLEELRLLVLERRLEAELARGRHADVLGEIQTLVSEHPLREPVHGLLMLALYRCGRQAEALEAYRSARAGLVEELGISPGPALQELEGRILRQDPELLPEVADGARPFAPRAGAPLRSILVAPLELETVDALIALAEPLAREPEREIVAVATVAHGDDLALVSRELEERRGRLVEHGVAPLAPRPSRRSRPAPTWRGSRPSMTWTCCSWMPPAGCSRTRASSPCSIRLPATSECWRAPANGALQPLTLLCSSRSEGPRTTGPRWSSVPGLRATPARHCVSPAPPRAPRDGTPAACSRARRSPCSTPSACPPSRCWWTLTPRRWWPPLRAPPWWSWGSPSAGGARVSGRRGRPLRRVVRLLPCSSAAGYAPGGLAPRETDTRFTWTLAAG